MTKKEQLRADQKRLNKIYIEHNIPEFRLFVRDMAERKERSPLRKFVDSDDETLSYMMYTMKSKLMYLGEHWHEARNVLRAKQFWCKNMKISEILPLLEKINPCVSCQYFRTAPEGEEHPCMHLGSIPQDISCPEYIALPK